MKAVDINLKDLLKENSELTFLVGAGCSVDAPSNLPTGLLMMEAIVNYFFPKSEINKILTFVKSGTLRFEALIEIIGEKLSDKLAIIEYYGLCNKPNAQHFFLAEMIKGGNFVITTNFDFLIEYALLKSCVSKEDIVPVITKEDYEKYNNPKDLYKQGKRTVYKIHGSIKNIITEESTRNSLVATIQGFGLNKEGLNIFQIEPFKRPLFDNISNNCSLIVMGYSGNDDFDIVPTLKVLKNLDCLFWFNFVEHDQGKQQVYEFEAIDPNYTNKTNQILVDIKRADNIIHVYRVDVNTSRIINELVDGTISKISENFDLNPYKWFKEKIKIQDDIVKYKVAYEIYKNFDMFRDALRCLEKILTIATELEDIHKKAYALNNIGLIYEKRGNHDEAIKWYKKTLDICKNIHYLAGKMAVLNNIAGIHRARGNFPEGLKLYKEALKISEELGDLPKKLTYINNIGQIYYAQGNYVEALKAYEKVLKHDEQTGNLLKKAIRLNNIGQIYTELGKFEEALRKHKEALMINEQLSNLSGMTNDLNNIGEIFRHQENYDDALTQYEKALKIDEKINDLSGKAVILNNIGLIYKVKQDYNMALNHFKDAFKIHDSLRELEGKASSLRNIADIYNLKNNLTEALNFYEEALKIFEQLGALSKIANLLNNIGTIYQKQEKNRMALIRYSEALQIAKKLGISPAKAKILRNIAVFYDYQGRNKEALKYYEEVLIIYEQLGLINSNDSNEIRIKIQVLKNHD